MILLHIPLCLIGKPRNLSWLWPPALVALWMAACAAAAPLAVIQR
ncbi:MAG: hypothetical protein ABR573_00915 [Candidatus Dormibacteria bacterium]